MSKDRKCQDRGAKHRKNAEAQRRRGKKAGMLGSQEARRQDRNSGSNRHQAGGLPRRRRGDSKGVLCGCQTQRRIQRAQGSRASPAFPASKRPSILASKPSLPRRTRRTLRKSHKEAQKGKPFKAGAAAWSAGLRTCIVWRRTLSAINSPKGWKLWPLPICTHPGGRRLKE